MTTKKKKNGNIAAFMTVDHRGRRAAGRRPNKTNPNAGRKKKAGGQGDEEPSCGGFACQHARGEEGEGQALGGH